jgi:hypothetical protein
MSCGAGAALRARSPTSRLLSSGDLTSRYHLSPRHDVDVVRAAPRRSMLRTGAYLDDDEYYGEVRSRPLTASFV